MSKYRNKKVAADGFQFDSQMEYRRYCELKLLQRAGEIKDLHVHPKYKLLPKYYSNSQHRNIPAIIYTADFTYLEDGKVIVEDVKGVSTTAFNLKRRLFEYHYPSVFFRLIKSV